MPEHDTIILIPCYNEEKTIKKVFKKLDKVDKEIDDIWLGMDELSNPLN